MSSVGQIQAGTIGRVVRFVNFKLKVNTRSSSSGNDETTSSSRQLIESQACFPHCIATSRLIDLTISLAVFRLSILLQTQVFPFFSLSKV